MYPSTSDGQHGHQHHSTDTTPAGLDRFPSRDEFFSSQSELDRGLLNNPAVGRQLERLLSEHFSLNLQAKEAVEQLGPFHIAIQPGVKEKAALSDPMISTFLALHRALQRPRRDHRTLTPEQRQQFNEALQMAFQDGSYSALAAVHENMNHRMHSSMGGGYIGGQRFLPWHRLFLLKMEDVLRSKKSGLTIPFWHYSNDTARPDWVWKPPSVVRNTPGNGSALPTQAVVDNLVNNVVSFTSFANGLEFDAHNEVHNWCNGTLTNPMTASRDPIFWLLHANVDRLWDDWQTRRSGVPDLKGMDQTLDPWPQSASQVDSALYLGYVYS